VIVLDASLVIAHLSTGESNHHRATATIASAIGSGMWMSPVNLAEVLVGYARDGRLAQGVADIGSIGIEEWPMPSDAAIRLADIRAATGLKLPDCCVLVTAETSGAAVASFDARLRDAAVRRGLRVVP
jgi:predicted nucleic acid-binding protein